MTVAGVSALTALALAACAPQGAESEDDSDDDATSQPAGDSDSDGDAAAGDGDALKVGYISPITGNFAVAGQEMVDGWELYWDINGNEVGGVTVETIVEDDAGNPEMSITKARKLVESDNVDVVVGPLLANTALAVASYTSGAGVPNLARAGSGACATRRATAVGPSRDREGRSRAIRDDGAMPGRPTRLLAGAAPELEEWASPFSRTARKRVLAQAGIPDIVTAEEADTLVADARRFLDVVIRLRGFSALAR